MKGNPHKDRELISRKEFESKLSEFGLSIAKDTILKYVDTYPQNQVCYTYNYPKIFTMDFNDHTGHGWANLYSDFYYRHTKPKTVLFKAFKSFIEGYTFKIGSYYYN